MSNDTHNALFTFTGISGVRIRAPYQSAANESEFVANLTDDKPKTVAGQLPSC